VHPVVRRLALPVLHLLGGLLLGSAAVARRSRASQPGWLDLLDTFQLYLLAPWASLGLLAGWLRAPLLGALAGAGGTLALQHSRGVIGQGLSPAAGGGPRLRVLSANVLARNPSPAGLVDLIRQQRPDLVLLQEVRAPFWTELKAQVGIDLPHACVHLHEGFSGAAILSRHPLLEVSSFQLAGRGHICQQATLCVERQPIRLFNIHLQTNFELHRGQRGIPPLLIRHRPSSARDDQILELRDSLASEQQPTLVCGDFNSAAGSRPHRLLRAVLRDAFQEAGRGLGHTWPESTESSGLKTPTPLLRIDYAFFRGALEPCQVGTHRLAGSDHRAVLAEFEVRAAAPNVQPAFSPELLASAAE
jgi:endonuclease/exonuclease/phosphatase (EEP) superfamily protein YafD